MYDNLLTFLPALVLLGLTMGCRQQTDTVFRRLDSERTGIDFSNDVVDTKRRNILKYEYFYNGGGVSIGDINNDSRPDLFLTGNLGPNRLYLNQGNFTFRDITRKANLYADRDSTWNTGTTMVDVNDDGYLDIYVCRSGNLSPEHRSNLLFINQGDSTFREAAASYGLDDKGYSIQAAFFDYDEDRDLDVYVMGHPSSFYGSSSVRRGQGRAGSSTGSSRYESDRLYENRGGRFVDVTEEANVKSGASGYGLGVSTGDLNGDGFEDIYVANDFFEHDYLYYNDGDGTFTQAITSATRHISYSSMGVDIADFNNDARLDISVLDMAPDTHYRRMMSHTPVDQRQFDMNVRRGLHYQYAYNTLQRNNGNGTFSDVAWMAGVARTNWSWAPLMADFNNDGRKDLFVTNGIRRQVLHRDYRSTVKETLSQEDVDTQDGTFSNATTVRLIEDMPRQKVANHLYAQTGDLSFSNRSEEWGLGQPTFSNGAAYADLNNDGTLDLVVNNLNDRAHVYKNTLSTEEHHYLRVQLVGPDGNRDALGAKVHVIHGDTTQLQQKYRTRGYQSSVEGQLHFGLGASKTVDTVRVIWNDGSTQQITNVSANQGVTLSRSASAAEPPSATRDTVASLFTEAADTLGLDYRHEENRFDDFRHQPLLPHRMSTLGPDLASGDVNGDGREDVFVGGARRSAGRLFLQGPGGTFAPARQQPWEQDRRREDLGTLLFDADGDGDLDLYVVSGGSSYSPSSPLLQDRLYVNAGDGTFEKQPDRLPDLRSSGSCVTAGDYDRDGDLDLFVGGRGQPQQYPRPSRSALLENQNGRFVDVTEEIAPGLASIGMVTDALWTDVFGDDRVELIVTGEWMSLRVFAFREGEAREVTQTLGLTDSHGWWFTLAEGDFDDDGESEYVAGNNGLNFRYQASPDRPLRLFADDYNGDGTVDPILARYDGSTLRPVALKDVLAKELRFVGAKFPDHSAYAQANMEDLLGTQLLESAQKLRVQTFATSRIRPESDSTLALTALPQEAQLSAVTDLIVRDLNADGHTDILLAGNLYEVEAHTPRNDAGNGLVLLGNEDGSFTPLDLSASGFFAPGNVKSLEWVETRNGPLVLVGNNDGPLQAFLRKRRP